MLLYNTAVDEQKETVRLRKVSLVYTCNQPPNLQLNVFLTRVPANTHMCMGNKVTAEINRFYDACCLFEPLHESPASLLLLSWKAGPASGVADRRLRPESKSRLMDCICVCVCMPVWAAGLVVILRRGDLCMCLLLTLYGSSNWANMSI